MYVLEIPVRKITKADVASVYTMQQLATWHIIVMCLISDKTDCC